MSKLYYEYFGEKDFYDSVADVLYDIMVNRLSQKDVVILADELVEKKLISEKSIFLKEEESKWNKQYVNYLMNGAAAGKMSKQYLIYYSNVSTTVQKKKQNLVFAGAGCCILIILSIILIALINK